MLQKTVLIEVKNGKDVKSSKDVNRSDLGSPTKIAQHMSCAGANMVHCPGYADDLRQYTTLNMDTRANRGFPAL